jgi:hypothetical protein
MRNSDLWFIVVALLVVALVGAGIYISMKYGP